MAQPGNYTPILLYGSSTPTNVPLATNLTNSATGSEIAINVADKNLFFKDSGGVVNTVPIRQSSTSSNGWLSSTDWNTFNGKASATSGSSILYGNGAGGFSNVTVGTGLTFIGGTLASTASGGTVTSVAATVPAFLSISGSPITTSGTLAITLSGTALPVANGGTGVTTSTGSGNNVLSASPTLSGTAIIPTINSGASTALVLQSNGTTAITVDVSQNVLIGGTGNASAGIIGVTYDGASKNGVVLYNTDTGSANQYSFAFNRNGTLVGSVTNTNTITAYNVSSDYRLKENIIPLMGALEKIAQLKPSIYNYKIDKTTKIEGFIAHELQAVFPHAVTGEKDAIDKNGKPVYQGVDASFLIASLTAAIQELNTKFEAYIASHP